MGIIGVFFTAWLLMLIAGGIGHATGNTSFFISYWLSLLISLGVWVLGWLLAH